MIDETRNEAMEHDVYAYAWSLPGKQTTGGHDNTCGTCMCRKNSHAC